MNAEEKAKKIAKLPLWARRYIARLENDIERCNQSLFDVQAGDTSVQYTDYINTGHLPDKINVIWTMPNGEKIEVQLKDSVLFVRGHNIYAKPRFANEFIIGIE